MSGAALYADRGRARDLRAEMTPAERRLWRNLKRLPLAGSHFRRQVAIGPFIADFACLSARLVLEVDGEQHGFDGHRRRDEARTRWLESQGFRVLRFWNGDVLRGIDDVLATIHAALPPELLADGEDSASGARRRGRGCRKQRRGAQMPRTEAEISHAPPPSPLMGESLPRTCSGVAPEGSEGVRQRAPSERLDRRALCGPSSRLHPTPKSADADFGPPHQGEVGQSPASLGTARRSSMADDTQRAPPPSPSMGESLPRTCSGVAPKGSEVVRQRARSERLDRRALCVPSSRLHPTPKSAGADFGPPHRGEVGESGVGSEDPATRVENVAPDGHLRRIRTARVGRGTG